MLKSHDETNGSTQTQPPILLSEFEKKYSSQILHVFRQLHEILHGKIFITYQQYDVLVKCIDHYKSQLVEFRKKTDEKLLKSLRADTKERHTLTISKLSLTIPALEKLANDLTRAKQELQLLQSKLTTNTLHVSATQLIASGQTLQLTIKSLQEYVSLATSILTDPAFAIKLLRAMALVQLQTINTSGLRQYTLPLLEKMGEKTALQIEAIKQLNLKAIRAQPGLPQSTSPEPIAFLDNPIGKSTCFFPNIQLCLENCVAILGKITENNSDIQAIQKQIAILLEKVSGLAKKVNMVAPSTNSEDYILKLLEQDSKIEELECKVKELKQESKARENKIMYALLEQDALTRLATLPSIPESKLPTAKPDSASSNIGSSMIKNIQEFSINHPYIASVAGVAVIAGFFLVKKAPSFESLQLNFWKMGKQTVSTTLQTMASAPSVALRR